MFLVVALAGNITGGLLTWTKGGGQVFEDGYELKKEENAYEEKFMVSVEGEKTGSVYVQIPEKELEKEQQKDKEKASIDPKKDKKKDPQTDTEKKDEIKNILVELNGLEDRIIRLTPNSSNLGSTIISKDGETLYYLSAFEGGFDLWKMDLRKKETKLLHKMNAGWASMDMDKDGKSLFVLGGNAMLSLIHISEPTRH